MTEPLAEWVPEQRNRPTTVSLSATSSTIPIRMSGNDARNGAIQARAGPASRGA